VVLCLILGFGNACLFGNGLVMLGQYFSKRRSLANGLSLSGASLGQFAIPPLLQYLLDTFSLKVSGISKFICLFYYFYATAASAMRWHIAIHLCVCVFV
jgi:MFS family permease